MAQRTPDEIKNRIEALEGVLVAYTNIHELVDIIATHDDDKHDALLAEKFGLTPFQAEVVKQMRLRRLSPDELKKTEEELATLKAKLSVPTP